ncbi:putative response regulator protein GraR [Umbribacter vaginalis]|nr:putative response regulator protein GraR [Coriobacteriales bacterium DNF00809]
MTKIAIIEDDTTLRNELAHILELQDFLCVACDDFVDADHWLVSEVPDCVIVDLGLPGNDGLSICRAFRAQSQVPIMVLTASDSEFDEIMAMGLGADDYLTKPYRPAVLLAHLQAALRRAGQNSQVSYRAIVHRGVEFNSAKGTVSFGGRTIELSRNEQRILDVLMSSPGQIVTRQELICKLWDTDDFIDDNTLTVNVNRVRKQLAALGAPDDFLQTKRGQGYLV